MQDDTRTRRWLRFLVGGGINTAFTYAAYLLLDTVLAYQVAYLVAYAGGVVFSYWFNAIWVFRVPLGWSGLLSYPVVYAFHYAAGALLLGLLVEYLGAPLMLAPLFVVAISVPATFVLSRWLLRDRHRGADRAR